MENINLVYEYFRLSMKSLIKNKKMGGLSVKRIASELGVTSSRVSLMHQEGTKKPANFEQQVRIAHMAGMSYEDFLRHGRLLLEGSPKEPTNLKVVPFPSKEKPKEKEVSSESDLLAHVRHQTQLISEGISMLRVISENINAMRNDFKKDADPLSGVGGESKKEGS